MIALQITKSSIDNIQQELDLKIGGIEVLQSQEVLSALSGAVFTISSKTFIKAMNMEAKSKPKAYHHIYEWNQIGQNKSRLFFLSKVESSIGTLIIKPFFKQSTTPVPINPELLLPGKTGKVVTAKTVFRDKASVMESGNPVVYRTSRPVPIFEGGKINFIAAGTMVQNSYPGGKEVKGSFEKFFKLWFSTKVSSIISSSGMIGQIDSTISEILNKDGNGAEEVKSAIIEMLKQYSQGVEVV